MMKVKIYGRLRKFIGQSVFEINAHTPKDAFSFLITNFEGVREHIKEQEYCVMAEDIYITPDLLNLQTDKDIKIIPIVKGEIFGWLFSTAITLIKGYLLNETYNLIKQGIENLFTKDPEPNVVIDEQDPSFTFTGTTNISKQGVPINIVYGETLIGTNTISADVDTLQVINT